MKWRVSAEQSGKTLLQFLRECYPKLSAKALKRQLDQHRCRLNGRLERFSSAAVGTGDEVILDIVETTVLKPHKILFEDRYLKVIDKPSGVTSESLAQDGAVLVHRLDKPTSGALILAKSPEAFERMVALFRKKSVEKTYLTLVSGRPTAAEGKIENELGKLHEIGGQTIWGSVEKGQHALTFWKLLQKAKGGALIEARPITGRTHQIRVHLASIAHPIVGDAQYSTRSNYVEAPRVMLHAYRLSFPHPYSEVPVNVTATPPDDFIVQMKKMGLMWDATI